MRIFKRISLMLSLALVFTFTFGSVGIANADEMGIAPNPNANGDMLVIAPAPTIISAPLTADDVWDMLDINEYVRGNESFVATIGREGKKEFKIIRYEEDGGTYSVSIDTDYFTASFQNGDYIVTTPNQSLKYEEYDWEMTYDKPNQTYTCHVENDKIVKVTVDGTAYTSRTGQDIMTDNQDGVYELKGLDYTRVSLEATSKVVKLKNGKKAVKVTWAEDKDRGISFDGYAIYRSTKKNSGYGTKPIFIATKNCYYNTAIKSGKTYYYKVRAYKIVDGKKVYTEYSTKTSKTVK